MVLTEGQEYLAQNYHDTCGVEQLKLLLIDPVPELNRLNDWRNENRDLIDFHMIIEWAMQLLLEKEINGSPTGSRSELPKGQSKK